MEWSLLDFALKDLPFDLLVVVNIACLCSIYFIMQLVKLAVGYPKDKASLKMVQIRTLMALGVAFGWTVMYARLLFKLEPVTAYGLGIAIGLGIALVVFSFYKNRLNR